MHNTRLVNMGFVKKPDGTYYSAELNLRVTVRPDVVLIVHTLLGPTESSIDEFETAVFGGVMGEI